ncbi:MAG TPA: DUF4139 domain-containing protein [Polyangiaceae bacterium]|nr:DUF4139 domain-containing protein [Polyangiaceae bacterium]
MSTHLSHSRRPPWSLSFACLAALMCACGAPHAAAPLGLVSELPVTRVVLYQNGVGYFERSGSVDGEVLNLQARPSQINDLLKSLTVIDQGSGRAVSASLPLEETADRQLGELPEQVRGAGGLLEVLRLFRGARVEIEGERSGGVAGRVIGVEDLQADAGEQVPADWRVSLKTPDGEVIVYPVSQIRTLRLEDPTLSLGLERSLDVSLGEGGWKPIGLSIRLAGPPPHRLLASYIVEMPRWKPAYRMVLAPGEKPLLQGWAVVDNVSGEHWQDVSLSLVSGTPISFKYNLHAPQYTERADLTPAGLPRAAAPPPSEGAGYASGGAAPPPPPPAPAPSASRSARDPGEARKKEAAGEGYGYEYEDDALNEGLQAEEAPEADAPRPSAAVMEQQGQQAETAQVGTLFRYDVRDKVTIPDRSSTLVNIVNQRITGEEVVYFRPELSSNSGEVHPYRAVKLENATGITLEKGPITVYSGGTFVGEGFVERMESGSTSFLTFALDAQVLLDRHGGMREEGMRLLRIVDGQLLSESQRVQVTKYEVKSHRKEAVRAYIRNLKTPGWSLTQPIAGSVETAEALIVPLDVPANGAASIEVEWRQPITRNVAIDSSNASELLQVYLSGGKAPPELERVLRELLEIQAGIAEKRKEAGRLELQHRSLSADSERVRENLNVLRRTRGNAALEQQLARKLATLERDLGVLSGRLVQLSEEIAEREAKLTALIRNVKLDASQ